MDWDDKAITAVWVVCFSYFFILLLWFPYCYVKRNYFNLSEPLLHEWKQWGRVVEGFNLTNLLPFKAVHSNWKRDTRTIINYPAVHESHLKHCSFKAHGHRSKVEWKASTTLMLDKRVSAFIRIVVKHIGKNLKKVKQKTNIKDNQSYTSICILANGEPTKVGWVCGHVASSQ